MAASASLDVRVTEPSTPPRDCAAFGAARHHRDTTATAVHVSNPARSAAASSFSGITWQYRAIQTCGCVPLGGRPRVPVCPAGARCLGAGGGGRAVSSGNLGQLAGAGTSPRMRSIRCSPGTRAAQACAGFCQSDMRLRFGAQTCPPPSITAAARGASSSAPSSPGCSAK